ncbi:MAG: slipin family protein [Bacteroidetes bacterium]|nr:slipin family protein [Bacteroidota bacterium]
MNINILVIAIITVFIIVLIIKSLLKRVIIYDWEKGLKYKKGKYIKTLDAGSYWIYKFSTAIQKVDTRPRFVSVPGQEVLSSDSVSLKVSIVTQYKIDNPFNAVTKSANYEESLYTSLQIALREIIGNSPVDELLEKRNEFSKKLFELTNKKLEEFGLKLISADLKDIMFPGELKKMFSQIVKAKKEGLAILERARGESAALRNLANAAKMIEDNPNLMQLRMIQALSESSGSTIVLNTGNVAQMVPLKSKQIEQAEKKE